MNPVAVVDYGMSNLDSVVRALQECGGEPYVAPAAADLERAARIVLPGVGSFADGMRRLRERGQADALRGQVARGVPLLGICLGMQLLASKGHEGGENEGLGLVEGEVVRLKPAVDAERIPHVGWNEVAHGGAGLFAGLPPGRDFYFVHSYHLAAAREGDVAGRTPYAGGFVSAVTRGAVFGVQFHPEKSQKAGFQVLRNFLALRC